MVVKTVVASVVGAVAAGVLANGMGVLLAGVAISAVVKAVAILAVSGIVGLMVSFGSVSYTHLLGARQGNAPVRRRWYRLP